MQILRVVTIFGISFATLPFISCDSEDASAHAAAPKSQGKNSGIAGEYVLDLDSVESALAQELRVTIREANPNWEDARIEEELSLRTAGIRDRLSATSVQYFISPGGGFTQRVRSALGLETSSGGWARDGDRIVLTRNHVEGKPIHPPEILMGTIEGMQISLIENGHSLILKRR